MSIFWQMQQKDPPGETPDTVTGAAVIGTEALVKLMSAAHPVLIDVANADKKPQAAALKDVPWMPAHRSIPGAAWLPGAGSARSDPAFETAFKTRVSALTGANMDQPLVVFCHPGCWGSWNAAKRLVRLGHRHVYWYPEGIEGWQEGHGLQVVQEDQTWTALLRAAMPQ